jgi:hypothetical protein
MTDEERNLYAQTMLTRLVRRAISTITTGAAEAGSAGEVRAALDVPHGSVHGWPVWKELWKQNRRSTRNWGRKTHESAGHRGMGPGTYTLTAAGKECWEAFFKWWNEIRSKPLWTGYLTPDQMVKRKQRELMDMVVERFDGYASGQVPRRCQVGGPTPFKVAVAEEVVADTMAVADVDIMHAADDGRPLPHAAHSNMPSVQVVRAIVV